MILCLSCNRSSKSQRGIVKDIIDNVAYCNYCEDGVVYRIENMIFPTILKLREKGYITTMSCYGHINFSDEYKYHICGPYIHFQEGIEFPEDTIIPEEFEITYLDPSQEARLRDPSAGKVSRLCLKGYDALKIPVLKGYDSSRISVLQTLLFQWNMTLMWWADSLPIFHKDNTEKHNPTKEDI